MKCNLGPAKSSKKISHCALCRGIVTRTMHHKEIKFKTKCSKHICASSDQRYGHTVRDELIIQLI